MCTLHNVFFILYKLNNNNPRRNKRKNEFLLKQRTSHPLHKKKKEENRHCSFQNGKKGKLKEKKKEKCRLRTL